MHYNGYPAAEINGGAGAGLQLGPGAGGDRRRCSSARCRNGMTFEWTELAYQEPSRGNTMLLIFPLCVLLVYVRARGAVRELVAAARRSS